jgi:hypothetical protein
VNDFRVLLKAFYMKKRHRKFLPWSRRKGVGVTMYAFVRTCTHLSQSNELLPTQVQLMRKVEVRKNDDNRFSSVKLLGVVWGKSLFHLSLDLLITHSHKYVFELFFFKDL